MPPGLPHAFSTYFLAVCVRAQTGQPTHTRARRWFGERVLNDSNNFCFGALFNSTLKQEPHVREEEGNR